MAWSAHTLKGSVGVFGAEAAADAAQRLETLVKRSDLADAKQTYDVLEREVTRLTRTLRTQQSVLRWSPHERG